MWLPGPLYFPKLIATVKVLSMLSVHLTFVVCQLPFESVIGMEQVQFECQIAFKKINFEI